MSAASIPSLPHSGSFPCSLKIMFLPAVGRGSQRVVIRVGTSEMSDVDLLGVGVLPSQRKASSQGRREWRKGGTEAWGHHLAGPSPVP